MTLLRDFLRRVPSEASGAAIALVALTMVVLLSCVALAVDVGMLVTARTEAQTLADGAALEGARVLMKSQGNVEQARTAAIVAGSTDNTVRGENVPISVDDVDVIPEEWTVRVRVHRTADRANAVPTYFARIFGVSQVDITADAAAWSVVSTTVGDDGDDSCPVLPLALIDEYVESNGDRGWQEGEEIIGFDSNDHGKVVRLKSGPSHEGNGEGLPVINDIDFCRSSTGGGGGGQDDSWRCWWRHDGESPSVPVVQQKIHGPDCGDPLSSGDVVYSAPGNMQTLLGDFQTLIDNDPDLSWCDDCGGEDDQGNPRGCVVEGLSEECFTGSSKRLRSVPIVDQTSINGNGNNKNVDVVGFMGVFVEKVSPQFVEGGGGGGGGKGKGNGGGNGGGQDNLYLRLLVEGGSGTGGSDGGADEEGMIRTLQLIE